MKISTFVLKLVGNSVFVLSFASVGFSAEAAMINLNDFKAVGVGVTDKGTVKGALNQANSAAGQGFGKSFTTAYLILGATDGSFANDGKNTGNETFGGILSFYRAPVTFTEADLLKSTQQFTFKAAFNGTPSNSPSDNFFVFLLDRNNSRIDVLSQVADAPGGLIPKAKTLNPGVRSNLLRSGEEYQLTFGLQEFDRGDPFGRPRPDTQNTAFGFNDVSVKAVPEPSSVLGVLAFGAFGAGTLLRRQLKKRRSATP